MLPAVMPHLRVCSSRGGHIFPYAWRLEGALVLILFTLSACASRHITDGFLVDEARGFRIPMLRDGWRQIEVEGTELAFRAEPDGQVAALVVGCEEEQPTTLRLLARRLFFGITPKKVVAQNVASLNGIEAVHTMLMGRLQDTEVMVSSYVAKDGECTYDLIYVAPPALFQERLPEFERFVKGWALTDKDSEFNVQSRGKAPQ